MLFSILAALIYIPTNSVAGFPFLHNLYQHPYWSLELTTRRPGIVLSHELLDAISVVTVLGNVFYVILLSPW